ncbi:ArsR family transcriptional regulator [Ruegeria marisrubri]|uniref:ArsR family transcriptional regulator n=1 Tax=Ruegeria marisrubri TaxID=1685379 RepID=A0A0X3TYG2_9RHOB|nr:helix-turn-helix domain-containing protein [Ruegeria marisrubri]KUJ80672.1 ArsR family transcriptional regulator [Ruegeria marisrubri]
MEQEILARLTTLGHPGRMAAFRLLARRYPDRVPAGEIAEALGLKANTLSAYLSALMQAGLVTQTRAGTSLRYRVRWDGVHEMTNFLLMDCCRGRPEICAAKPDSARSGAKAGRKWNVLFTCTGNSARSIFAEAILRHQTGDLFNVYSAGTRPQSELHPLTVKTLKAKGHDVSGLRAKHVSQFRGEDAPEMDFVFTVCDQAANEECPVWAGQPISAHWGVPDPAKATGTEAERRRAFEQAYDQLRRRITAFAALPVETLDRVALQARVDDISMMETTT